MTISTYQNVTRFVLVGGLFTLLGVVGNGCADVEAQPIQAEGTINRIVLGPIGSPCLPYDESDQLFSFARATEVTIETNKFECESSICLINHFQGRVTCPLGQPAPVSCTGPDDSSCGPDASCMDVGNGKFVCHRPGSCQSAFDSDDQNAGKPCCAGGDYPVADAVCGQCGDRKAEDAVYCSCRCGAAEGAPDDGSTYCACPDDFECKEVVAYVGGDPGNSGKYCVKKNTAYEQNPSCGAVSGYHDAQTCQGTPAP